MSESKLMIMVVVMVIASFRLQSTVAQTSHVVGDTIGWAVPSGNFIYNTWASGQTFNVGDTLIFNFTSGSHDVAEVSQAAYDNCSKTDLISQNIAGPATLKLTTSGNHYYICTVGPHCSLGQKLTINVALTPNDSTSPPPPSPSSASSFIDVVPVTFMAAALALYY